jgi:hypothetical protein
MLSDKYRKGEDFIDPITHVPRGDQSSHNQLCRLHNLTPSNCVGFAITKNSKSGHTFTAQSMTLNLKFRQASGATSQDAYVPLDYATFLMAGLQKTMPEQISSCNYGAGIRDQFLSTPKADTSAVSIDIQNKISKDADNNKPSKCCR